MRRILALGLGLTLHCEGRQSFVTVNLSTDFLDAARPGDWVEAHVEVQKMGKRMAFANCFLQVGARRILRASGVFAVMNALNPDQLAVEVTDPDGDPLVTFEGELARRSVLSADGVEPVRVSDSPR